MAEEVAMASWNALSSNPNIFDLGIKKSKDEEEIELVSGNSEKEKPSLKKFLREQYFSRRNQVNKEIQIKSKKPTKEFQKLIPNGSDWVNMDDTILNQIFFEAKDSGVKYLTNKRIIKDKFNSGFSDTYNPILDYVESLPKWDGKTDHITIEFNKRIKAKDQKLSSWMFKKWFVGMVATSMGNVLKTNETVLILKGRQNLGKTRFIGSLLPKELREYMMSGILNPNDKDHLFRLATNIIYNLDELASMRPSNTEKFKQLISLDSVKARRPFAHFDTNEKVICSFTGTVNEEVFLHDLTGNRRFLVIDVMEINNINLPHDKIFSQAVQLAKSNFEWWFTDRDVEIMKQHTDKFRYRSTIEELIDDKFKPARDKNEADTYLNSTEILSRFKKEGVQLTDTNNHKVGRVMTSLGFKSKKIGGLKKYAIDFKKRDSGQLVKDLVENKIDVGTETDYSELPY